MDQVTAASFVNLLWMISTPTFVAMRFHTRGFRLRLVRRLRAGPVKPRFLIPLLMIFSLLGSGCGSKPSPDFTPIDRYLTIWDQFAQGDNSLGSRIKQDREAFEQNLADALTKNDSRVPSRFVFYAVVQVGGFIPLASPLGQAFQQRVGDAVPIFTNEKDGSRSFFAGDLYFWWEAHKSEYVSFTLHEEWRQRDFAQNVAIKMYQSATKNRK
jgi:hypothetical protein